MATERSVDMLCAINQCEKQRKEYVENKVVHVYASGIFISLASENSELTHEN
jgi:hypothetical protein